ncbi:MAG: HIT domain-containing protein [Candidatus Roizmanbacteria bacterium]|nr:HIT domain-containing protein [Candidatus Roizmanbacteria bacterium]
MAHDHPVSDCIFCKIVAHELPSHIIYEDADFLAFLDIYPTVQGHTLVIPKKHARWVYDVPNFGSYWEAVLKVTRAIQRSLQPTFVNYFTYGEVPHAHIHILPRFDDITDVPPIVPRDQITVTQEELAELAARIRK